VILLEVAQDVEERDESNPEGNILPRSGNALLLPALNYRRTALSGCLPTHNFVLFQEFNR